LVDLFLRTLILKGEICWCSDQLFNTSKFRFLGGQLIAECA